MSDIIPFDPAHYDLYHTGAYQAFLWCLVGQASDNTLSYLFRHFSLDRQLMTACIQECARRHSLE